MAVVKQPEDNSWYVVCAACCVHVSMDKILHFINNYYDMALVFAIIHLYHIIIYCFCPFRFSFLFYKKIIWYQ